MSDADFDRSVFINCPFDKDYEPILQAILQAILFCVVYFGFEPRLATERIDSAENRLEKIRGMIEQSKYSIHDLSRCIATKRGELYRLNMPFELGIDYGCRQYFGGDRSLKRILILEEKPYRYQAALSDMSGCDILKHDGDYQTAVRQVRNWLASETESMTDCASRVLTRYEDFQGWYYDRQLSQGFSKEDIEDYLTRELLDAMRDWVSEGKPV